MHVASTRDTSHSLVSLREELFVRAECFLEALDAERISELPQLARRLSAIARIQFAAEEAQLEAVGALSLVRHVQEHRTFLTDLDVIAAAARAGDRATLAALRPGDWLTAWLAAHGRTDHELAPVPAPRVAVAVALG